METMYYRACVTRLLFACLLLASQSVLASAPHQAVEGVSSEGKKEDRAVSFGDYFARSTQGGTMAYCPRLIAVALNQHIYGWQHDDPVSEYYLRRYENVTDAVDSASYVILKKEHSGERYEGAHVCFEGSEQHDRIITEITQMGFEGVVDFIKKSLAQELDVLVGMLDISITWRTPGCEIEYPYVSLPLSSSALIPTLRKTTWFDAIEFGANSFKPMDLEGFGVQGSVESGDGDKYAGVVYGTDNDAMIIVDAAKDDPRVACVVESLEDFSGSVHDLDVVQNVSFDSYVKVPKVALSRNIYTDIARHSVSRTPEYELPDRVVATRGECTMKIDSQGAQVQAVVAIAVERALAGPDLLSEPEQFERIQIDVVKSTLSGKGFWAIVVKDNTEGQMEIVSAVHINKDDMSEIRTYVERLS